jgi:menaquinone-9 beta-reductase
MTDVIVVGGGIAGSALAILLGRAGLQVELYERGSFPREKPCGEGLMPAGVAALERLGLREAVGGAAFVGVRYHTGKLVVPGRFPTVDGRPTIGMGQRRWRLDAVLFDEAARTAGVTARACCPVEGPVLDGGRVIGCEVRGEVRRAALVVAADGLHSRFRRLLGLDAPAESPPSLTPSTGSGGAFPRKGGGDTGKRVRVGIRAHFRLAAGQTQPPWVEVFLADRHELYVTPLPNEEILVAGLAERDALRGDADAALHRWIQAQPVLAERLRGAEQLTRVVGPASVWRPGSRSSATPRASSTRSRAAAWPRRS